MSSVLSLNPIVQQCFQAMAQELSHFPAAQTSSEVSLQQTDRVVLVLGKIYDCQTEASAALFIDGKVECIGHQWEVEQHLRDLAIEGPIKTLLLSDQQCIIPSFVLPQVDVFAGIVTKQWLHLGPFGLQANWQKPMPNYNLSYVYKALSYFDKSLPSHHWLVGYGLDTQMMPYSPIGQCDGDEDYITFLDKLAIARAICIFDKSGQRALLNTLAATAIYLTFGEKERKAFPNIRLFLRFIEMNQGLTKDYFGWLAKVMPPQQMQLSAAQSVTLASEFKDEALRQGISAIGLTAQASVLEFAKVSLKPLKVYAVQNVKDVSSSDTTLPIVAYPDNIGLDGYRHQRAKNSGELEPFVPLKSIVQQQQSLAFNCEFPERPLGALRLLSHAVNREMLTAPGYVEAPLRKLNPEQALSVTEALQCLTYNPARCLDASGLLGRLSQGSPADFLVLSGDPFKSPSELSGLLVTQTWIDGLCVYASSEE
jgi:hypothetical protein